MLQIVMPPEQRGLAQHFFIDNGLHVILADPLIAPTSAATSFLWASSCSRAPSCGTSRSISCSDARPPKSLHGSARLMLLHAQLMRL
jgi:hypothetical protein